MPISTSEAKAAATDSGALKAWLAVRARAEGFDVVRVARPALPAKTAARLGAFLGAGHHGEMAWMARNAERRGDPAKLWPEAKSAVVLGLNYGPEGDPLAALAQRCMGAISVYAQGADYHDPVKRKLKAVARDLAARTGADVKVFVDTAPLMEKPLAERAGAGWQGKHTNLVSRGLGSWLFLGEILTTAELIPDAPEEDHCGSCRACLDACPTDAFPAPYRLDARRCISYLTIEHKGHIAREFRKAMGNRIYGCDDCLAVCPWNKFARAGREAKLKARPELVGAPLAELAALDEAGFRRLFAKSPVKRTGRSRFLRNVLIAVGNSGARELAPVARARLGDDSALVRAMAVWALGELVPRAEAAALARTHLPRERDVHVAAEWRAIAD